MSAARDPDVRRGRMDAGMPDYSAVQLVHIDRADGRRQLRAASDARKGGAALVE